MYQSTVSETENKTENLVQYAQGTFTKTYKMGGAVYYASFHPELYRDAYGLDATGRYLVVLLQPGGLSQFYMSFNGDRWIPSEEHFSSIDVDDTVNSVLYDTGDDRDTPTMQCDLLIAPDMLEWLSEAIITHNKEII